MTDVRIADDEEFEDSSLEALKNSYLNSKSVKDSTLNRAEYAIDSFLDFCEKYNLSKQHLDADTRLVVQLDIDNFQTNGTDQYNILDYWVIYQIEIDGYARSTVRTRSKYVCTWINYVCDNDPSIDNNPVDSFSISDYVSHSETEQAKHTDEDDYIAIRKAEYEQIVKNLPTPKDRNRLIIDLGFKCGLRASEIAALKESDVDLQHNRIKVPGIKTEPRTVWFGSELETRLRIWIEQQKEAYATSESEYLLVSYQNGTISERRPNRVVIQAAKNAGIQEENWTNKDGQTHYKYTSHSLRHGFAVECVNSGIDVYALKELMGHASINTTEKYMDSEDDYLRSQVQQYAP